MPDERKTLNTFILVSCNLQLLRNKSEIAFGRWMQFIQLFFFFHLYFLPYLERTRPTEYCAITCEK